MGTVYEVEHIHIGVRRALKVLRETSGIDSAVGDRFLRGARNAAGIDHPNVCRVFDFGSLDGQRQYLLMELVPGRSLDVALKSDGRFDLEKALVIARSIARALAAAHALGVIHRDLKPPNVMLGNNAPDGSDVRVVDFDIARKVGDGHGVDLTITGTSFAVGTPEYMSPEQVAGHALDGRSDLYSLGLILYRMLSGTLPFPGSNSQEVMTSRLLRPPVPIREAVPELALPDGVTELLHSLLSLKRVHRPSSADEVVESLDRELARLGSPSPELSDSAPSKGASHHELDQSIPSRGVNKADPSDSPESIRAQATARRRKVFGLLVTLGLVGLLGFSVAQMALNGPAGSSTRNDGSDSPSTAGEGMTSSELGGGDPTSPFFIDSNGVTIRCPDARLGDQGEVGGITYTKRSREQITPANASTTCTSGITNMARLFADAEEFNGQIGSWDVSQVTDMSEMFSFAQAFDQDISSWDVSSARNMDEMFYGAWSFRQDIGSWDVQNVLSMNAMFEGALSFDGDIGRWDVQNVRVMDNMFRTSTSFNQDLSTWCVRLIPDPPSGFDTDATSWTQRRPDWGTCSNQ